MKANFEEWKSGDALHQLQKKNSSLYECVLLLLEPYWEPGSYTDEDGSMEIGSHCKIIYDPTEKKCDGKERPVEVALFHELCHAHYAVQGRQLGLEGSPSEENTLYEGMTVGLHPHHH